MRRRRLTLGLAAALALGLAGWVAVRAAREPDVVLHVVERSTLRNEILASGWLDAVRKTPISVPADLNMSMRVSWLAPPGPVAKGDVVLSFDPADLEKDALDSRADRSSADSKRDKTRAEAEQKQRGLDLDLGVTRDELERARDVAPDDERIFSRNQIVEGQLDRDLIERRLTATGERQETSRELTAADLELVAIERRKAEMKLRLAEKGLGALRVGAPHDGILVFPANWRGDSLSVGDTVWPGQTIAEIPDLSQLEARVFVLEGDASGLEVGRSARLEVEGQPGLVYEAKVKRVDALAKSRERGSPVKYFETWLDLPADAGQRVKPGQRVRARILLAEIADAVWVPRGALFQKDGRRYVLKADGGELREQDVTLGGGSLGRVQVLIGLAPGDRVALADPRRTATGAAAPAGTNGAAAPAATGNGGR